MSDLTARLDAIQKRAEAATPGPWRTWKDNGGRRGSAVETAWAHDADGADTELITDWCSPADAEFIAASPENTRFLLDLARKQQAALDAVKTVAELLERSSMNVRNNNLSIDPNWDGRAAGYEIAAKRLREALEAKP
jgi:hypothetical protein